jgi:hypothetical protein
MRNNGMRLFFLKSRIFFLSLALAVLLASCLDDDDHLNQPVPVAFVSLFHAVPDAPDFDIVVDGRVINSRPFEYSSYTGYLNFYTGNRGIKFNVANADNAVVDTIFSFEDQKAYSVFAVNTLSDVEALLVVDSADAPSSGKAMIRFVNLSPDAPAFELTADGSAPLFTPKAFKEATQFQEIDAGKYSLAVSSPDEDSPAVTANNVELDAGKYYTVVTRGFVIPPVGNNNVLSIDVLD